MNSLELLITIMITINEMKNGKAHGIDGILVEIFMVDAYALANTIKPPFRKI